MKNKVLYKWLSSFATGVLLFVSCVSSNKEELEDKEGIIVQQVFFDNGSLLFEQEYTVFLKDTIKEGYYREFYESGELRIEGLYKNNRRQGVAKSFYKNGVVATEMTFAEGKENGEAIWYYEDGSIKSKVFFENGMKVGEGFGYHKNGNLKAYIFYGDDNNAIYRRDYDESGKLLKEKGSVFPMIVINEQVFRVGDSLIVDITHVNPPECEINLYVGEIINKKFEIWKKLDSVKNNHFIYVYNFFEKRDFYLCIGLEMICTNNDTCEIKKSTPVFIQVL